MNCQLTEQMTFDCPTSLTAPGIQPRKSNISGWRREAPACLPTWMAIATVATIHSADFITTDDCDGIHFTAQNNHDHGKAIADKVKEIFEREALLQAA